MSIERNQELRCFYLTQSRDWLRKPASNFQPIKCKIKANRNLVIRVFPRLKPVLFQVPIGFCDCFGLGFTTLNRNVQRSYRGQRLMVLLDPCASFNQE